MDRKILEKIEDIYNNNLLISQKYNQILETFLKFNQNQFNRTEIFRQIDDINRHCNTVFEKIETLIETFSSSEKL